MSTGRRTRQAALGGTGFADRLTELAVAGVPGEAARAVEDGQLAVGVVVDAHLGPDEVGPQRAPEGVSGILCGSHKSRSKKLGFRSN